MSTVSRTIRGMVCAAALLLSRGAIAAERYTLEEVPLPPDCTGAWPADISDTGQVVGAAALAGGSAAFSFRDGITTLLTAPAGHVVYGATAVNAAGQIVGGLADEVGIPKSALWMSALDGAPLVLESSGGPDANVYTTGINGSGVICGYYTGSGSGDVSSWRAVTWTPDGDRMRQRVLTTGVTPLPPGVFHAAYGINDAGIVVGTGAWVDPDLISGQAAIRWSASGQASELATLTGVDSYPRMCARAINEAGVSVGELTAHDGVTRGVRWNEAGEVVDLGLPGGFGDSEALDINDAGVIVGALRGGGGGAVVAAIHEGGAWVDLNARLIGAADWALTRAVGVNAAGQIVAEAQRAGQTRAVVLTPAGLPGDMNCDGAMDNGDIDGFVLALLDRSAYEAAFPGCAYLRADTNGDGGVDNGDIDTFVQCLLDGGC